MEPFILDTWTEMVSAALVIAGVLVVVNLFLAVAEVGEDPEDHFE